MPHANRPGEFELIRRYFAPLAAGCAGALSLTDDAAFVTQRDGQDLIITTDAVVEAVHFLAADPPDLIARKALRVNLSDLAGKGAVPFGYVMDLCLPDAIDEAWIAAFAGGLAADQAEFGVQALGGDTTRSPGPLMIAITALGNCPTGRMLLRAGARVGDDVWVSGTIGDAALGLMVQRGGLTEIDQAERAMLRRRYLCPEPRVRLGPLLINCAHGACDVSDGLAADFGHIAEASRVAIRIEAAAVPLSAAATSALANHPDLMVEIISGGDDYEVAFTAPPESRADIAQIARETETRITRIGVVAQGRGVSVLDRAGFPVTLQKSGYTHF
jgi:thiamine-monophosphate kinase